MSIDFKEDILLPAYAILASLGALGYVLYKAGVFGQFTNIKPVYTGDINRRFLEDCNKAGDINRRNRRFWEDCNKADYINFPTYTNHADCTGTSLADCTCDINHPTNTNHADCTGTSLADCTGDINHPTNTNHADCTGDINRRTFLGDDESVAIFFDIENAVNCILDSGQLLTDIVTPVRDSIKTKFSASVSRECYAIGDLRRSVTKALERHNRDLPEKEIGRIYQDIRMNLSNNGVTIEDLPYINHDVSKDQADDRIVYKIRELLDRHPKIRFFVIMAADRYYETLIKDMKEKNKTMIIISPNTKGKTNKRLRDAAERKEIILLYFKDVVKNITWYTDKLRNEYTDLIVRVCAREDNRGRKIREDALLRQVKEERVDFDHKRAGYVTFIELLEDIATRGKIMVDRAGRFAYISLV